MRIGRIVREIEALPEDGAGIDPVPVGTPDPVNEPAVELATTSA